MNGFICACLEMNLFRLDVFLLYSVNDFLSYMGHELEKSKFLCGQNFIGLFAV